jgi:hypothetical protein
MEGEEGCCQEQVVQRVQIDPANQRDHKHPDTEEAEADWSEETDLARQRS